MAKPFKNQMIQNKDNVLVVDGFNLGFRWLHSGAKVFSDDYIDTVKSLARSYNCGSIIITSDWGASSYRKALLPSYKANRKVLREKQTDKEAKDFQDFMEEFNHTLLQLEAEGLPVFKYKGVEADDIAAFIAKEKDYLGFNKVWLVSTDRDWDLLITKDVSRFSYINRADTTFDNWSYEFPIEEYITYKALTGDKGDNIPGIKGVGPMRAVKIMEDYGTIFDIYDACPLPGHYKYIQELNANAETLLLNVELMDLVTYCEEAIGDDNCKDLMVRLKEYTNGN